MCLRTIPRMTIINRAGLESGSRQGSPLAWKEGEECRGWTLRVVWRQIQSQVSSPNDPFAVSKQPILLSLRVDFTVEGRLGLGVTVTPKN